MEWIEPPPPDMGAWDIAGIAAKKIGGRVLNGVVERHLGMDDVDVAGAVGMVGGAVVPMIQNAYAAHEGEPWYETWGRRTKWTLGIAAGAAVVGGAGYLAWRFLGRNDEPVHDDEGDEE